MQAAYDKIKTNGYFKALLKNDMIVWVSATIIDKIDVEAVLKV